MSESSGLLLTEAILAEMREHVERLCPEEACGLLGGLEGRVSVVIPVSNELHSPLRFRMDPREMLAAFKRIEQTGEELVGIYHSHPKGPAVPSPTDQAEFAYPGTIYLIWSPTSQGDWQVRGFSLDGGIIQEAPLAIMDSNL
ncbi:MAG TPA: M67 family metallopeptidase [Anaerolineaceae bacterium]|nr:M67 family metallopeptidase [Anaerolineaceae bacterium]